jgi:hypothetical protein
LFGNIKNYLTVIKVKRTVFFIILILGTLAITVAKAQFGRSSTTPPTYEELYDAPYEINKLFVHFQPICAELFTTNLNAGMGIQANYYWDNKVSFNANARTAYNRVTDFSRDVAEKNKGEQFFQPYKFNYFEAGGTYHLKDFEQDGETKFILYSRSYKGTKWAAKVPDFIKAPTKVRRIYGVRLGGTAYKSAFDLRRVLDDQDVVLTAVDSTFLPDNTQVFGNISAAGGYVGISYAVIRNAAIKFDKIYSAATSDHIFTAYFDILAMPAITMENIMYNSKIYLTDNVKTNKAGFRLGMEGKFNREFGWAYGAEMGMRPGVKTRAFFANIKISFPVYSTTLSHQVEAFGK